MLTQRSEKELLPPPRAARTQGAAAEAEVHEIMFSASQPTLAALGKEWKRACDSALALRKAKDIQEVDWQAKNKGKAKSEQRIPKKKQNLRS